MIGCHARWVRAESQAEDLEQIAIREALPSARLCRTSVAP
jgi:hypothetical protein